MKFDYLYTEHLSRLDEQPPVVGDPMSPDPGMEPAQPVAPPKQVSTEGRRFMVELALKALAFDPNTLSEQDRDVFDQEVTQDNADQILDRIRQITTITGVQSSAEDDQWS